MFYIFGVLVEFERDIIRERTQAELEAARARGKKGDRPKSLTASQAALAQKLYNSREHSIAEICQSLKITRATLYPYLKIQPQQEKTEHWGV